MVRKPNKLRKKLNEGKVVTGSVIYSWSPNVMEIGGYCGLDFMRIDNEHAWRQDKSAEHLIRAATISNVVPLIRVDRDNPFLIRKALEIGAGAILVPNLQTPDEIRSVVKASKFPPLGIRGYSGSCWSAGWGTQAGKEWVQWSNAEPMIGVMIENESIMDHLDEILSIEGLDYLYFGPADYSMSLGLGEPKKNHPDVQDALKTIVAKARKCGVHVAFGVGTNLEEIQMYIDMGINMLEIGNDLNVLKSVWESTNSSIKNMV
jgi:4-hydroxy-2-oxoheptanedioate aldolase